jgi:hypothetical protein
MTTTCTIERPLTWDQITKLEPALAELYRTIRAVKDDKTRPAFCANLRWYGSYARPGFKQHLSRLAGWDARHPDLQTIQVYELAYGKLYRALPNCRNCACL